MAEGEKVIATNRKAHFNYEIVEKLEAGIALVGSEVKSLREGKANLSDAYAMIEKGEAYLYHCHISPYDNAGPFNHEPLRVRKLLLHRREIEKLIGKTQEKGFTLVPTKLYFKKGRAKVEIGLAKGKKLYDKRETIKRREQDREMSKAIKRGRERG
ncbi:MAG: SsrA-binding protein SmpB [bacterium]